MLVLRHYKLTGIFLRPTQLAKLSRMRPVIRYPVTSFLTGIIIPAVLMACAFQSSNIFTATIIQPADHESNRLTIMPPTFEALSNMTDAGIYEDAITLKDGRWAGEPYVNGSKSRPIVGIVKDFMLTSDLDGDNSKEVAAILTENTGGSGNRSYVVIAGRCKYDSKSVNLGTALIGDRVQLQNGRIEMTKLFSRSYNKASMMQPAAHHKKPDDPGHWTQMAQ